MECKPIQYRKGYINRGNRRLISITPSYAKNQSLSTEARKAVGFSTESVEPNVKATDRDLVTKLFKSIDDTYRRIPDSNQIKRLATNEQTYRKNLDEPLIIEYPVESIIPYL